MSQTDVDEQVARRAVHDTISLNAIDDRVSDLEAADADSRLDTLEAADLDSRVQVLEDPGA